MPSLKHKIIKVKAEKIVFPGKVLCRCEDGIALFTQGLLPNEEAEIFVTRDKKSFREGKLENIIIESSLRKIPKCQSFGNCGGCSFQHTDYINQIDFKTNLSCIPYGKTKTPVLPLYVELAVPTPPHR